MRFAGLALAVLLLAGCVPQASPTPKPAPAQPAPEPVVETQAPTREPSITDSGPQAGAEGPIALNTNGTPWKYTVVEGDTADQIRYRFDLWWDQLSRDGEKLPKYPTLYPGDVLTIVTHDPALETGGKDEVG